MALDRTDEWEIRDSMEAYWRLRAEKMSDVQLGANVRIFPTNRGMQMTAIRNEIARRQADR